jgi:hypothetical protein
MLEKIILMKSDRKVISVQPTLLISQSRTWRWGILGLLFTVALAIRIYGIDATPLDFHPVKQYRSALTARAFYYDNSNSIPEWKQEVAFANLERLGILVPPILDYAVALLFRVTGAENLWIPRLLSALFWMFGGGFLYLIAREIIPVYAAVVSVAFYLLLPFGVIASQSFQPDPLMIMAMIIGLFAIIRFYHSPSRRRLLVAAFISAIAIFVKPVCVFIIFGAFAALSFHRNGIRKSILGLDAWIFVTVSVLPAAIFYGYGIFTGGALERQAQVSFVPQLVLQFRFWDGWLKRIRIVMGYTYFILGLIGLLISQKGWIRAFLIGLWTGYFVMCFVFTYTISTHDYYHLPLVPIVALSLGPIATSILDRFEKDGTGQYWRLFAWAVLFLALFLSSGTSVQARRKLPDFDKDVRIAQEIGEYVAHSTQTILLAPFYGKPLMYHGELSGDYWPHRYDIRDEVLLGGREMTARERFDKMNINNSYEYFIVTDLQEFEGQKDLKTLLTTEYPLVVENGEYLIFDLRGDISDYDPSRSESKSTND